MSYIGRQLNLPASTVQLTANNAITAGKPCVIQTDGDVAQVQTGLTGDPSVGTAVVWKSQDQSTTKAIAYDTNAQKLVIAYRDTSNGYGYAVVATISASDNSISFGTPVAWNSYDTTDNHNIVYDSTAQKVVIVARQNDNKGKAVVGTVSGTSISFGSVAEFASTVFQTELKLGLVYDASTNRTVIAYRNNSNADGEAIVGTVSGTSISFGTAVTFESASSGINYIATAYDANAEKVVIAYQDGDDSNYGKAIVGTVSGTSISFGTAATFESADTQHISATYDANAQKVAIFYQDRGNSYAGTGIVGTISGTSISFGSPATFLASQAWNMSSSYDSGSQKIVVIYSDRNTAGSNTWHGNLVVGTISGTSISFGSPLVYEAAYTAYSQDIAYDANAQRHGIIYADGGNSYYGTAIVAEAVGTNLTSENFIGFAENDCTDNGLATIQLGGLVNDKQTSLTAGQTYFVQTDGTIGTSADSPSVTAGTAVSSTEILVKG